jgi:hypothetical protein
MVDWEDNGSGKSYYSQKTDKSVISQNQQKTAKKEDKNSSDSNDYNFSTTLNFHSDNLKSFYRKSLKKSLGS